MNAKQHNHPNSKPLKSTWYYLDNQGLWAITKNLPTLIPQCPSPHNRTNLLCVLVRSGGEYK